MSDEDSDSSGPSLSPPSLSLSPVLSIVRSHLSDPRSFLSPSEYAYQHCIEALRNTFNLAISIHTNSSNSSSLPQLYTEGFDQEQIWQQLELWNLSNCQHLASDVQQLLTADIQILPTNEDRNSDTVASPDNSGVDELSGDESTGKQDSQIDSSTEEPGITNSDTFLNPVQMEKFLQREEKRFYAEGGSDSSSAGESEETGQDAAGLKYKDFFEDKSADKPQSNYSRARDKMQTRIALLERDNVAEKSWDMSGEVRSTSRPDNSLLEGYMEHQSVPLKPLITQDTTEAIEEMICRRARDELWDDPVRREKPKEKRYNYSVPKQVETQKSQLGLAEVYEQEFQKKSDGSAVQRSEEQGIEEEVKKMMSDLFAKLDALSNFRYTPKAFKYEPIVITNVPAVRVEEVLPSAISESARLAPEEVSAPSRHAPVSAVEKSREDRRQSRRQKKRAMSRKMVLRAQKLVDKSTPGMGTRYSKRKLMEALGEAKKMQGQRDQLISDERARKKDKSFRSSKSFFSKLEEEARSEIKHKSVKKRDKPKVLPNVAALKFS